MKYLIYLLIVMFLTSSASAFAGGDGTAGNPYQIINWTDLNVVRNNLTAHYILNNSLSSSDAGYAGIGDDWASIGGSYESQAFLGSFNGQGYNISDLKKIATSTIYISFIGYFKTNLTEIE